MIKDMLINNEINWQDKFIAQLVHYKKKAPFYNIVIYLLSSAIYNKFESIVDIDNKLLQDICKYLDINTPISIFSKMNLNIKNVEAPDEWALNICLSYGADQYINLPGGRDFFNKEKYENTGIKLNFLQMKNIVYSQKRDYFEPWLSIIDVMMFNDVPTIQNYLNQYDLI